MLMPFASAFSVHNLGLTLEQLPLLYGVTGVFNIALGPLIGKWSDRYGKYLFFAIGTGISLTTILYYTHLGVSPLWLVIIVNVVLFLGITARRISGSALMTGVPAMTDRGAFMSVSSSIQQFSGGIASTIAGMIVLQQDNGPLQRYDVLGYVVSCTMVLVAILMGRIDKEITGRRATANPT